MGKKHRIKIICSKCKRSLASENAVWTHIAFQHSSAKNVRGKSSDSAGAVKPLVACTGCDTRFESESDLLAHIQAVEDEDQTKPETNKLDDDATKPKSSLQQDGSKPESSKQKDGFKQEKITQPDKEIVKCSSFKFYCALCRKKCDTENALLTHIAFKHVKGAANLTAKYICDNCKQVFDSLEEVTNHCHVVDNTSLDDDNSIVLNSSIKSNSSLTHSNNKTIDNCNSNDASDFIKDKPFIRSSSPKQDGSLATLEDSFEGEEGIHVVKDLFNENDDFDDFEDEEYSKIDDILESSGNIVDDKDVLEEKDDIPEISKTSVEGNSGTHKTANDDLSDIVSVSHSNANNDNKDNPKNDAVSDLVDKRADNSKNIINDDLSHSVIENNDDLKDDNNCDIDVSHENPEIEKGVVDLDTSTTSSKDLSLSDLLEDEEGFENKVNLFSTMLTNEVLSSRVKSLEEKVVELQEYMKRLLEDEDFPLTPQTPIIENEVHHPSSMTPPLPPPTTISSCQNNQNIAVKAIHSSHSSSNLTSVIQCDKIESTTGSFDLLPNCAGFCEGEVVTFMDESVCEVEVNTSRSDEFENMERDDETDFNIVVDTNDFVEKTNYALNEPVFQTHKELQDDDISLVADSSQQIHNSLALTNGTACESLGLIIENGVGETLGSAVTTLEADQVGCMEVDQVGCMEDDGEDPFDSVLLEQIRNGCISGMGELDSLFTSVISPQNQDVLTNVSENSSKIIFLNPDLEEKENQQLEATSSKLEPTSNIQEAAKSKLNKASNTITTKSNHKSSALPVNEAGTVVNGIGSEPSSALEADHSQTMVVKLLQTKSLNGLDAGAPGGHNNTANLSKQRQAAS